MSLQNVESGSEVASETAGLTCLGRLAWRLPGLSSRVPPHPGRYLQTRFLEPMKLTQQELAARLGISRRRINELIRGRRGISPDTALRLSLFFGTEPTLWLEWQVAWDLHRAWRNFDRDGMPCEADGG